LNRIPTTLRLYVHDNLGVAVLGKEISGLAEAGGRLRRKGRREYEVWLASNTLDDAGLPVATGVYTFRIFGVLEEDGQRYVLNKIVREGVYRKQA